MLTWWLPGKYIRTSKYGEHTRNIFFELFSAIRSFNPLLMITPSDFFEILCIRKYYF